MSRIAVAVAASVLAVAGCSSPTPDRTAEVSAACETALAKSLSNLGQDVAKPQADTVKVTPTDSGWTETGTVFVVKTDADGQPEQPGAMRAYECAAVDENGTITARATISLT